MLRETMTPWPLGYPSSLTKASSGTTPTGEWSSSSGATSPSTRNLDARTNPRDTPARTSANALSRFILDTHGRLPRLTLEFHVTSTDTTATPTDSERETAREIVVPVRDSFDWACTGPNLRGIVDRVAQALADQRARYEAVADQMETTHTALAVDIGRRDAARCIRAVAEGDA